MFMIHGLLAIVMLLLSPALSAVEQNNTLKTKAIHVSKACGNSVAK